MGSWPFASLQPCLVRPCWVVVWPYLLGRSGGGGGSLVLSDHYIIVYYCYVQCVCHILCLVHAGMHGIC